MDDYNSLMYSINQMNNSLIGAANMYLAADTHKQDRKFAREMYERQVEDNRKNWELMNEYNSPSAQRERLQAAGLNENLVYGSGGVTGTTSMPQSAHQSPSYGPVPQFGRLSQLTDYMQLRGFEKDLQLKDAQLRRQELENDYLSQTLGSRVSYQSVLSQNLQTLAGINFTKGQMLDLERNLKQDEYNVMQLLTHGDDGRFSIPVGVDSRIYLDDLRESDLYNATKAVMDTKKLSAGIMREKLDGIRAEAILLPLRAHKLGAEVAILEFQKNLWGLGINPNDPLWARLLVSWFGSDNIRAFVDSAVSNVGDVVSDFYNSHDPSNLAPSILRGLGAGLGRTLRVPASNSHIR